MKTLLGENKLRWAVIIASTLLISVFFLPFWQITLIAPQYPEGLNMTIWIDKVTGDLRNINILNHYIGMRKIVPNEFPEFKIFGPVFIGLIVTGYLAALVNKKIILRSWVILLFGLAIAAGYDFYRWEYDFGHNLDPDAAIKAEGMTYQPPLIGVKYLLNIEAWSLPGLSGYAVLLATGLSALAMFFDLRDRKTAKKMLATAALSSLLFLQACTATKPSPIDYGKDQCASCKMSITDSRFAAEAVTQKGKTYKFDSIECMHDFKKSANDPKLSLYVTDSANQGRLIRAEKAYFVKASQIHAPMGEPVLAAETLESIQKIKTDTGAPAILEWKDVHP